MKSMKIAIHHLFLFSCIFLGNLAQAEAVGREALELIPNDHSLMFSLANVLGKSQKYKVSTFPILLLSTPFHHYSWTIHAFKNI